MCLSYLGNHNSWHGRNISRIANFLASHYDLETCSQRLLKQNGRSLGQLWVQLCQNGYRLLWERARGTAPGYKPVSQHTFKCLVTYHVAKTSISNWAHVSNTTAEPEGITRTLCLTLSSFYTLHLWITFVSWKQSSQQVKKDNCVFRNHFWAQSQPSKLGTALLKFKKLEQYKK